MPEIQISRSDDDRPTRIAVQPEIDESSEGGGSGGGSSFEGTGTGTCSHYCGGWQSSICANQLSDEDLRKLVVELKRKVEFTERMNWLCKLRVTSIARNCSIRDELIRSKCIFQAYQNDRSVRRIERPVCPSTPR